MSSTQYDPPGLREFLIDVTAVTRYRVRATSESAAQNAALDHDGAGDDDNEFVEYEAVIERVAETADE
ncbi:hypothetical protein ACQSSU_20650 [Micromonospora echinospora]